MWLVMFSCGEDLCELEARISSNVYIYSYKLLFYPLVESTLFLSHTLISTSLSTSTSTPTSTIPYLRVSNTNSNINNNNNNNGYSNGSNNNDDDNNSNDNNKISNAQFTRTKHCEM